MAKINPFEFDNFVRTQNAQSQTQTKVQPQTPTKTQQSVTGESSIILYVVFLVVAIFLVLSRKQKSPPTISSPSVENRTIIQNNSQDISKTLPTNRKEKMKFDNTEKESFSFHQSITENAVRSMNWRLFEEWITEVLNKNGYMAYTTPPANDGGKDIIATKEGKEYYIECKHWSEDAIIGRELLQKLVGSAAGANVQHAIFVATCQYNDNAKEYTKALNAAGMMTLELWDMNQILKLANAANVTMPAERISVTKKNAIMPLERISVANKTETTNYLCPSCKKGFLRLVHGMNGDFWGCRNYPNCTATFDDIEGKPNIETKNLDNTENQESYTGFTEKASINSNSIKQKNHIVDSRKSPHGKQKLSSKSDTSPKIQFTLEEMEKIEDTATQDALKIDGLTDWDIAYMEKYKDKDEKLNKFYKTKESVKKSIINQIEEKFRISNELLDDYKKFVCFESKEPDFKSVQAFATGDFFYRLSPQEQLELQNAYAHIEQSVVTPKDIVVVKRYFISAKLTFRNTQIQDHDEFWNTLDSNIKKQVEDYVLENTSQQMGLSMEDAISLEEYRDDDNPDFMKLTKIKHECLSNFLEKLYFELELQKNMNRYKNSCENISYHSQESIR